MQCHLRLTALSFSPNNNTSSINVNLGTVPFSLLFSKSLGSYAIFALPSYAPEAALSADEPGRGIVDPDGKVGESIWPEEDVPTAGDAPARLRVRPWDIVNEAVGI